MAVTIGIFNGINSRCSGASINNAQLRETRPRNDEKLIAEAGIQLDRALFSILISIERLGPIGVVELAERAGRDHTTVSRQVAKLEKLGLIIRQHNAIDRRIREAVISRTGKAMTERIDAAREQMGNVVFKDWPQDEIDIFVRLMQKFADAMDSDASMPE